MLLARSRAQAAVAVQGVLAAPALVAQAVAVPGQPEESEPMER
jgi:hypothetical protein